MGYTEFTDRAGKSWRVWQTAPPSGKLFTALAPDWVDGWLTFESEGEKRRLAPVPPEWESLPPQRLELLCRMAEPSTQARVTHALLGIEERKHG
jgi:hypothetical protein